MLPKEPFETHWKFKMGPHNFPHIGKVGAYRDVEFSGKQSRAAFVGAKNVNGTSYHGWVMEDDTEVIAKGPQRPDEPWTDANGSEFYVVPKGTYDGLPG